MRRIEVHTNGFEETNDYMCIICAALINAILLLTGFWNWDGWLDLGVITVMAIFSISYCLIKATNWLAKKKSHR